MTSSTGRVLRSLRDGLPGRAPSRRELISGQRSGRLERPTTPYTAGLTAPMAGCALMPQEVL